MPEVTPIRDLKGYPEPSDLDRLIDACRNPRDKAFISVLGKTGMRITQSIQLEEGNIDFVRGTLSIVNLKERIKLKCPGCGEVLGRRHIFCPSCGNRVSHAIRQKVEQRRQRTIPVDVDTLRLLAEYLEWRRQFTYRGPLVFPFSRVRGWQLVKKIGQRAGIQGLHPHSFRHLLATAWVSKGLDVKKLQLFLGHASIATTMEYVDSSFEQLRSEYEKLWGNKEDETTKTKSEKNKETI
jgi:integrase/recombinase XerD